MDCGYKYGYKRNVMFAITILLGETNEANCLLQIQKNHINFNWKYCTGRFHTMGWGIQECSPMVWKPQGLPRIEKTMVWNPRDSTPWGIHESYISSWRSALFCGNSFLKNILSLCEQFLLFRNLLEVHISLFLKWTADRNYVISFNSDVKTNFECSDCSHMSRNMITSCHRRSLHAKKSLSDHFLS